MQFLWKFTSKHAVVLRPPLESDPSAYCPETTLFHGSKEYNLRVDIAQESTADGDQLPSAWDERGQVSEVFLTKECKYLETEVNKKINQRSPDPTTKPVAYFQDILEAGQEIRRIHNSHITSQSGMVYLEDIISKLGPEEKILCKIDGKAIINTPSTSNDLIGDCAIVISERMPTDSRTPDRRIYFFQVLWKLNHLDLVRLADLLLTAQSAEHKTLNGEKDEELMMTKAKIDFVHQTAFHLDVMSVNEQMVQIFYEQVPPDSSIVPLQLLK